MIKIGFQCKAYYLSTTRAAWAGSATNGVFVGAAPGGLNEMTSVRNATVTIDNGEADVSTRGSEGFELTAQALFKWSVDLEIPWDPTDASFAALFGAYLQRQSIPVVMLDDDKTTAGAQGPWADWAVMKFSRDENLDKEVIAQVTLKPTQSAVPPQWVKVS